MFPFIVVPSLLLILVYAISEGIFIKAAVLGFFIFSICYCSGLLIVKYFYGRPRVSESGSQLFLVLLIFVVVADPNEHLENLSMEYLSWVEI